MADKEHPDLPGEGRAQILLFEKRRVRRVFHNEEWHFVVSDVVAALTGSPDPGGYLKKVRSRDKGLAKGWGQIVTPLTVQTAGGGGRN